MPPSCMCGAPKINTHKMITVVDPQSCCLTVQHCSILPSIAISCGFMWKRRKMIREIWYVQATTDLSIHCYFMSWFPHVQRDIWKRAIAKKIKVSKDFFFLGGPFLAIHKGNLPALKAAAALYRITCGVWCGTFCISAKISLNHSCEDGYVTYSTSHLMYNQLHIMP